MLTDIVGDLLTRIRNGSQWGKLEIKVFKSNFICNILECLYREGYIRGYVFRGDDVYVLLKYKDQSSAIKEIMWVSKPSCRVYWSMQVLKDKFSKGQTYIYSSSCGIFSNREYFYDIGLKNGGEVLFKIK